MEDLRCPNLTVFNCRRKRSHEGGRVIRRLRFSEPRQKRSATLTNQLHKCYNKLPYKKCRSGIEDVSSGTDT
ncbi:hypothetical protein V5799_017625 [Amblyomma americanum]|uniref:Uncharacterized protein n=1 Tax=Amblyomma americanum TaxID=6943 RepID=A0AAQ4F1L0_AMBAM